MQPAATHSSTLPVPRLDHRPDGGVTVVRWGALGELLLRPGDLLIRGPATPSGLLLLLPRGRGRPMVGVREHGRLLALPGRVPASDARWIVGGAVHALERGLERGGPGFGTWQVAFRFEATRADPHLAAAGEELREGLVSARELEALCLRASLLPQRHGLRVAIAAAADLDTARRLVGDCPVDRLRLSLAQAGCTGAGQVIAGPWPGSAAPPTLTAKHPGPPAREAKGQVLLPFAADTAGA